MVPEAQVGGPIALVQDGDVISIDAEANTLIVDVSDEAMARRKANWVAPPLKATNGTLFKYARLVSDASHGCGMWPRTFTVALSPTNADSDRYIKRGFMNVQYVLYTILPHAMLRVAAG